MDKLLHSLRATLFTFFVVCLVANANAATVTHAEVIRKGKVFYLDSTLELNVPRDIMFDMLVDYDQLQHFSSGFVETKKFEPDAAGVVKVYTHIRGCVTFFCRHIKKTETLETEGSEKIVTRLVPEDSFNVKRIDSDWLLSDIQIPIIDGQAKPSNYEFTDADAQPVYTTGTKIRYRMVFQPDFWVPPIIGGYLVKKSLVSDGTQILDRMERYAQKHLVKQQEKTGAATANAQPVTTTAAKDSTTE